MGFTRLARRAGIHAAARATTVSTAGAPTKTAGSHDLTPNRKLAITRARPNAAAIPTTDADERQAHALEDDHPLHLRAWAPSASRIPISCFRCSTEYAIRP